MNPVFNETTQGYLRTRYRARDILIFDPCTPIFRAQVSAVPTGSTYLSISFDTVSLGAFGDVKIGQTVIISETSDHTLNPLWEGRVAAAASSGVLPINESAFPLVLDYYVTVLDTYKPLPRVRAGSLVDGRLAFQGQTGAIKNLPSAQVVISDTTGSFALNPTIDRFDGSTVSSIAWDIPGASYTVGSSSTLTSTVTMPADSHTWCRLTYTLSSGVSAFMTFQLIVLPLSGSTLPTEAIDGLRINRTWAGHHATARAYTGVSTASVMNGTRTVIASIATLAGGAVALDSVKFVGYLTRETNNTENATDKSVQFDIASIWERAAQLPMSPIAIRDASTPTRWDEISLPTAQNVTSHILSRYSTILELCALNVDDTSDTWYGGDMNVPSSSLGDAISSLLEEINAQITPKPSGELYLRRDLRYETDANRNAADTVWTWDTSDIASYQYTARHDEQTGRILIGFRGYFTNRAPSKGGKALAPSVILGTSPETQTRPNQLMMADLSDANLVAAAAERAGQMLAAENPPYQLSGNARPQMSFLNPNCFQWHDIDVPATTQTRGRAISGRHLLLSLEVEYDNETGSHTVQIEFLPETEGGGALVVADLTPNVTQLTNVITPPQYAYGGNYGGPSTLNVPDEDTSPAFNRGDMGGMGNPIPADQNYQEGLLSPDPGCMAYAISFKNPSPVGAGFVSVLGEDYTITASGEAIIEAAYPRTLELVEIGYPSTIVYLSSNADGDLYHITAITPGSYDHIWDARDVGDLPFTVTDAFMVSGTWLYTFANYDAGGSVISDSMIGGVISDTTNLPGAFSTISMTTTEDGVTAIRVLATSPLPPTPGGELYGDAFYQYNKDDEGVPINVTYTGALYFNGATAAVVPPLFNESHVYEFTWEGDGNEIEAHYELADYTDVANVLLTLQICGPGAAT